MVRVFTREKFEEDLTRILSYVDEVNSMRIDPSKDSQLIRDVIFYSDNGYLATLGEVRESLSDADSSDYIGYIMLFSDRVNIERYRAIYEIDISKFENTLVAYSVQLQQHFGLRREEAIKFDVSYADMGERIRLQPSWTKGGVYREIPITTLEQRALLDELKLKVGSGSLIPKAKKYGYQKRVYDNAVAKSGYKNLHGLRHAYAQRRYFEITNQRTSGNGWHAPFSGGKHRDELSPTERKVDNEARRILSRELGHSRKQIVSVYCGV